MKTIALVLLVLTLNIVDVFAKDFHLVARQFFGSSSTNSIYVLILADDNPVVFQTFHEADTKRVAGSSRR